MNHQYGPNPYSFAYPNKKQEFIIHSVTEIRDKKLKQLARLVIQDHQDVWFTAWKLKNPSWNGNEVTKKRALMKEKPLPNPVILLPAYTESLLKRLH